MASENHAHHGHDHGDHGDHHHDEGAHGTFGSYMTGFVLSVILTVIPFWLVMGEVFADKTVTVLLIMGFGAVQIVVHMFYFLHMNSKIEGGWTFMSLLFTVVIIMITMIGSLWVMYHLNTNMMPMSIEHIRNLP